MGRMTAEDALKHPWLSSEMTSKRKAISLLQSALDEMEETDARLLEEEREDYVEASFVFRTFEEEEYESPEEGSGVRRKRDRVLSVKDIDVYDVHWHVDALFEF